MRHPVISALIVATFVVAPKSVQAIPPDLTQWFLGATALNAPGTSKAIAAPDFLGGKLRIGGLSTQSLCHLNYGRGMRFIYANWSLLAYDRKRHIGLAAPHDDVDACAIFNAPTPAGTVGDADLSRSSTGRGLRIGSTYAQVLSTYGPPVKHGRHFVTSYSAAVPATTRYLPYKPVTLPERITLVIDNDRVSSMLIYINESGLY